MHGCALVYVFTRCSISDESAFADAAVPARKVLASCILRANVFNVALVEIGALKTVASEARNARARKSAVHVFASRVFVAHGAGAFVQVDTRLAVESEALNALAGISVAFRRGANF